jgi:hypothetical protein
VLHIALAALLLASPAATETVTPAAKPQAPAAAQAPAPGGAASAAAKGKAAAPAEKLICRREDSTGNRTSRAKLCMTKEQWKEFNRGA